MYKYIYVCMYVVVWKAIRDHSCGGMIPYADE